MRRQGPLARQLHEQSHMATGLKLVWSSSVRRALESSFPAGEPPVCPSLAEARALVDDWVCAGFESGPAAIEDLVSRVAAALARRDRSAAARELLAQSALQHLATCGAGKIVRDHETLGQLSLRESVREEVARDVGERERRVAGPQPDHRARDLAGGRVRHADDGDLGD
jgi:hypothetical protein